MNDKTVSHRGLRRAGALAVAAAAAVLATACASSALSSASTPSSGSAPAYAQELALAQCMRSHGVPDFPGFGQPGQSPPAGNKASVNPGSPQFRAALSACHGLLPPGAHVSIHVNVSVP
jgi:hypothetical protein